MSEIILPGGNGVNNTALETAQTTIGDTEVEYFLKPGVSAVIPVHPGAESTALIGCAQLVSQYGVIINALVREVVSQRDKVTEIESEAARDKAQIAVLVVKVDAMAKRLDTHSDSIADLQDAG
jgi:hypothetical protein